MLILLFVVSLIKTIIDLVLFCYSFRVLNIYAKQLQPRPNILQLILRMCANVVFTITFFAGIILK